MRSFPEPTSPDDATQRLAILKTDMLAIQSQLSSKDKVSPEGIRLSAHEYWTWRRAAVAAFSHKQAEVIFLKAWISTNVAKPKLDSRPAKSSAGTLLRELSQTVTRLDNIALAARELMAYAPGTEHFDSYDIARAHLIGLLEAYFRPSDDLQA